MTTGDSPAYRGTGWEAMHRTLAADAVVPEALLYATGGRRLTVEHGQPLTQQAAALVKQLVDDVDQAAAGDGYLGGGTVMSRGALDHPDVSARRLVPRRLTGRGPVEPGRVGYHPELQD